MFTFFKQKICLINDANIALKQNAQGAFYKFEYEYGHVCKTNTYVTKHFPKHFWRVIFLRISPMLAVSFKRNFWCVGIAHSAPTNETISTNALLFFWFQQSRQCSMACNRIGSAILVSGQYRSSTTRISNQSEIPCQHDTHIVWFLILILILAFNEQYDFSLHSNRHFIVRKLLSSVYKCIRH